MLLCVKMSASTNILDFRLKSEFWHRTFYCRLQAYMEIVSKRPAWLARLYNYLSCCTQLFILFIKWSKKNSRSHYRLSQVAGIVQLIIILRVKHLYITVILNSFEWHFKPCFDFPRAHFNQKKTKKKNKLSLRPISHLKYFYVIACQIYQLAMRI